MCHCEAVKEWSDTAERVLGCLAMADSAQASRPKPSASPAAPLWPRRTAGSWPRNRLIQELATYAWVPKLRVAIVDTQGQSTPVHALSFLVGIKLMPRIRNWKDLTFLRPSKDAKYRHIDNLFSDTVDWQLIQDHWPDLLRVALSIKAGTISSAP